MKRWEKRDKIWALKENPMGYGMENLWSDVSTFFDDKYDLWDPKKGMIKSSLMHVSYHERPRETIDIEHAYTNTHIN